MASSSAADEDTTSIEAFDMTAFLDLSSADRVDDTTLALCERMAVRILNPRSSSCPNAPLFARTIYHGWGGGRLSATCSTRAALSGLEPPC
jgi:hypothetical protein